jgi:hypothetical protein
MYIFEQVKCNRQLHIAEERGEVGDESDEEINHLKQRIRMRRRQRQEEKQRHLIPVPLLSDGKTDSKCAGKLECGQVRASSQMTAEKHWVELMCVPAASVKKVYGISINVYIIFCRQLQQQTKV